jgi:hypothetical protein
MARREPGKAAAIAAICFALAGVGSASERGTATMPDGKSAPRQCLFLPGTVVPRLAIGVRRLEDDAHLRELRHLEFRHRPSDGPSGIRRPLYRPLFVYAEHVDEVGSRWCLLGSDYAVDRDANETGVLGWIDARQLHFATSRYAYHFRNPGRVHPVELYRDEADAYATLESLASQPPRPSSALPLVMERIEQDVWDPTNPEAAPPFLEVRRPRAAAMTDTTPSFPLNVDNRLVHLAAVCGGPVDGDQLASKRDQVNQKAGVEILFVIDDTLSMEKYFPKVADFIEANLQGGGAEINLKIAVSWYRDREDDDAKPAQQPYDVATLRDVHAKDIPAVKKTVLEHQVRTIKGDGAQARELMCEGLQAALGAAGFAGGAHAMVFVIGDYGDRSAKAERDKMVLDIAAKIAKNQLQVAFIRVGGDGNANDRSFVQHAGEIREAVRKVGGPDVAIAAADAANLDGQIAKLQREMTARRSQLEAEIADLESRNRHSKPGPLMERDMKAAGLELDAFDQQHLQLFTPACGWLYNPRNPDEDEPQLRELAFISRAEATALVAMFAAVGKQLEQKGVIDGSAAIAVLADKLAGHSEAAAGLEASWNAIPQAERSLGTFLRDGMGLRVRNAVLFEPVGRRPLPATLKKSVEVLRKCRAGMAEAMDPKRVWYDSWVMLP